MYMAGVGKLTDTHTISVFNKTVLRPRAKPAATYYPYILLCLSNKIPEADIYLLEVK